MIVAAVTLTARVIYLVAFWGLYLLGGCVCTILRLLHFSSVPVLKVLLFKAPLLLFRLLQFLLPSCAHYIGKTVVVLSRLLHELAFACVGFFYRIWGFDRLLSNYVISQFYSNDSTSKTFHILAIEMIITAIGIILLLILSAFVGRSIPVLRPRNSIPFFLIGLLITVKFDDQAENDSLIEIVFGSVILWFFVCYGYRRFMQRRANSASRLLRTLHQRVRTRRSPDSVSRSRNTAGSSITILPARSGMRRRHSQQQASTPQPSAPPLAEENLSSAEAAALARAIRESLEEEARRQALTTTTQSRQNGLGSRCDNNTTTYEEGNLPAAASTPVQRTTGGNPKTPAKQQRFDTVECPICLDEFDDARHPATFLNCGHCFHAACINEWQTAGHSLCPTCMQPIGLTQRVLGGLFS